MVRFDSYHNRKPWLTPALKNSIRYKNKLYVRSRRTPSTDNINNYRLYRNKLNKLLRQAEREHFDFLLHQNRNNLRKSWSIIKDIINKNSNSSLPHEFLIDNNLTSHQQLIADAFNKFYVNIGPSLARKIRKSNVDPTSYINNTILDTMFLREVEHSEVKNIILSLKNSSPGWDNICPKVVKDSYECIIRPLTHIFNLSFNSGVFPHEFKLARVTPLYKSDNKLLVNNYRPVSILPLFSKILERLMYNRLLHFINKNKILYNYQFGFRKGYSTTMALTILVDKIMSALDKGDFVVGVFLDLSKAFDTVNHQILLNKLFKYGIRGLALKWFKSYLCERKQFVVYNNVKSTESLITCGVPQGSILGPLLFLLYINDMANVSKLLFIILFADDTNLFLNGKSVLNIIQKMNTELEKIVHWLTVNQLSLNINKTSYIIFSIKKIYSRKCQSFH